MRLVIDTDGGVDDAVAIILALRARIGGCTRKVRVAALTTVGGNVSAAQAAANCSIILEACGCSPAVPVYLGCDEPMIGERFAPGWPGHGPDGLGGAGAGAEEVERARSVAAGAPHAVQKLLALADDSCDTPFEPLDVVALGPLTNIALACKLDPTWPKRVGSLTIMGGATDARGNTTCGGEFNFVSDPEAAAVVLRAFTTDRVAQDTGSAAEDASGQQPKLTLVPWETCLDNALSWEFFDRLTTQLAPSPPPVFDSGRGGVRGGGVKASTAEHDHSLYDHSLLVSLGSGKCAWEADDVTAGGGDGSGGSSMTVAGGEKEGQRISLRAFLKAICTSYEQFERSTASVEGAFVPCDAYAVAALLFPDLVEKEGRLHASVECGAGLCRGMVVFDWYRQHGGAKGAANVRLVQKIHKNVFEKVLLEVFGC